MSFIVSSAELQKHLGVVAGVVPTKSVLPIIQNIRFQLKGGNLTLSATDLDNAMQTSLKVEQRGDDMDVALPAKLLQDTLKALPEQPLTFDLNAETFGMKLSTDNGEYELSGASGADFPNLPQTGKTEKINMPLAVLSKAIGRTLFASSNDELKPALNGMFFDFKAAGATFVATDAHRLVRYRRADITVKKEISFILPQKALKLIAAAAATGSEDELRIEYNDSNAFFRFGTTALVCRLIDARFPDYENVIPKSSSSKLVLNKKELLSALRRLDIYSNKTTHLGRFKVSKSALEVQSEDLDFSNRAKETLNSIYDGQPMEIGFNISLMIDIISNVDTDDVTLELETPSRAAVVIPAEQDKDENILMLLMPVMLSSSF